VGTSHGDGTGKRRSPRKIRPKPTEEILMSRVRVSAAALMLMVSGSALAEGPARLALPLPTLPGVALGPVLDSLPDVTQLLGDLGLATGAGGAAGLLPGLALGEALAQPLGAGAGLVLGAFDPSAGEALPGLLPGLGQILSTAAIPDGE
jgi:hypothetical protein